ncbi:MAG: hypothetical protein LBH31_04480 [Burkholderiaceae bacterium]|jgi:uncharacterized protein|nr:hypothetical protein [Burkholderiaceae bacterium]
MKFLLTLLTCLPLLAWSASFDCQKARNVTERAICADAQLSRFDLQPAQTSHDALQALPEQSDKNQLIGQQKYWIASVSTTAAETTPACARPTSPESGSLVNRGMNRQRPPQPRTASGRGRSSQVRERDLLD